MPKPKPTTAPGYILVPQAATLSHLDGSTVAKWCQGAVMGGGAMFKARKVRDPRDGRTRWHIEKASFLRWARGRHSCR